ncbi:MAG: LON peptidase substrate-binding domain-containing protein, partial [Bacteroidales bacterium]|nr:LON peptidase substrate-binding domain-containing protein [Bacteroidales bacterium]
MKDILDKFLTGDSPEMSIIPVMNIDAGRNLKDIQMPPVLPVLSLRNAILFPETVIPITVGREKSIKLVNEAYASSKIIGAVTQRDPKIEDPTPIDLFDLGTLGKIIKIIEMPDNTITAIVQGIKRFHIDQINITEPYMMANVTYLEDILPAEDDRDMSAIAGSIKDAALQIVKLSPNMPQEASFAIKNIDGYEFLINFIASSIDMDNILEKVELLRDNSLKARALKLLELLNKQIDLLKIKDDLQKKVRSEIDQQQREYYLNNQLKTIQEELGINSDEEDFSELKKKAKDKKWPDYAAKAFDKELQRLQKTNPNSPDFNIQFSYVEFLVNLPWDDMTKDNLDLKHAQQVLDEDHCGLEKVKERIIEYLAVLKLKGDMKSPILCLYGPPGVGKTSLGKSVARALGRNYGRISLGGLHDESEIRGHRRTYIGAMPGRIIETIERAGSANPVIVLDEIDKVSDDFRGDPASALLEVLDPEQNTAFHDNYLDIDYDLSRVLFIT